MYKMITLKQIKACNTIEDLEELGLGNLTVDIGGRGGKLGFNGHNVACHFEIDENLIPDKVGVYCNYLGGGIRGAICAGGYSDTLSKRKAKIMDELSNACERAYENAEAECGLLSEEYEDGDTNWDNIATKSARKAGVKSAY